VKPPRRKDVARGRKAKHAHYCPIARSLDLLGDRWTLLVLRELLFGEQRFSELRAELVGISPTLLTERLEALSDSGLISTRELPPPAARTVYAVTPRGREVAPILQSMARFGMDLLPAPTRATRVRPEMAVYGGLTPWYDSAAASGIDEVYRLVVDGKEFTLSAVTGRRAARERTPDLVLTTDADVLVDARQGKRTLAEAARRGRLSVDGRASTLANFQRIFRLP